MATQDLPTKNIKEGRSGIPIHSGAALPMFVMRVWCGSSQVKSIKDRCLTIGANPTSQGGLVWSGDAASFGTPENRPFSKGRTHRAD